MTLSPGGGIDFIDTVPRPLNERFEQVRCFWDRTSNLTLWMMRTKLMLTTHV